VTPTTPYEYVVTPNVDHIVRLHHDPSLASAYEASTLCVCDSQILRILARLSGTRLELVRGSDLTAAIFQKVIDDGDIIAVVGSTAAQVAELKKQLPRVNFSHYEPPMNLRRNAAARQAAAQFVVSSGARFTLIAVGSPQQEMIAHEISLNKDAQGMALCIGAGLDFVTGSQKRAPKVLQSAGLEWAHRLASDPRRLWKRYLVDGLRIVPIYLRWVRS
jgi:exopolysaccharide biosynthesis WecB/TagA/CpsF family protein